MNIWVTNCAENQRSTDNDGFALFLFKIVSIKSNTPLNKYPIAHSLAKAKLGYVIGLLCV